MQEQPWPWAEAHVMPLRAADEPPFQALDTARTIGMMGGHGRIDVHGDQDDLEPWCFVQRHGRAGPGSPRVFPCDLPHQGRTVTRPHRRIEGALVDRMGTW